MKNFRLTFLIIIIALLLGACGTAAPESAKPPIRLAVNLWPGLYPAAIAQEQGLFAKYNVPVEIHYYESYPQTYADFVAGKVDALSVVIGDMLVISGETKLNFVFPVDASDGADVVIAGSDINSPNDLIGKRIGVAFGTYGELFVRTFLEQNGVPITAVTLVNIPAESAVEAYPAQVDAIHTYEPFATEALKKGGHVLFTSSETPNLMLGAMTFPVSMINERPEDIKNFAKAWFEAVDWMNANQNETPALVAKAFGISPEDVWFGGDKVFTLAESRELMKPGDNSSSAYYITQTYVDFLVKAGALSTKPDPEVLINPSFLP